MNLSSPRVARRGFPRRGFFQEGFAAILRRNGASCRRPPGRGIVSPPEAADNAMSLSAQSVLYPGNAQVAENR